MYFQVVAVCSFCSAVTKCLARDSASVTPTSEETDAKSVWTGTKFGPNCTERELQQLIEQFLCVRGVRCGGRAEGGGGEGGGGEGSHSYPSYHIRKNLTLRDPRGHQ